MLNKSGSSDLGVGDASFAGLGSVGRDGARCAVSLSATAVWVFVRSSHDGSLVEELWCLSEQWCWDGGGGGD